MALLGNTADLHDVAKIRPLMQAMDIAKVMGIEPQAVTRSYLGNYLGQFGAKIYVDDEDGRISRLWFTGDFPRNVLVFGLHIGMEVSRMLEAMPDLQPPAGAGPGQAGAVTYEAIVGPERFGIEADVLAGAIVGLKLARPRYREWLAERAQHEAERREQERLKHERQNLWKAIADADEMLESWAANASPWGEASDKYVAFAQWLRASATPDQWHLVAQTWNWDYTHAPLLWIIRQPDCDKATALAIYFLGNPFFYVAFEGRDDAPDHALDVYDLLVEIKDRLGRGFYRRSEIAFDGEATMAGVHQSKASPTAIERWYPQEAGRTLRGRDLSFDNNFGGVRMPDFCIA